MSNGVLRYKDYTGSLQFSREDDCLYGRILDIDDLVMFEGRTVEEARSAFQEAVEQYLRTCAELDLAPDLPPRRAAPTDGER
jgi:predicted HicB family RNase H-like nuclease